MDLLNIERREEDKMKYASSVMVNEILLEENRATIEVRENEARTFRQFAKKEEHLKVRIMKDEGELLNMKKYLRFSKNKARSHLFGGSRDKVYSLRWDQTPNPLEVKILMARKVNEKLERAHYALNVTILDGFGGNEIFFKFSKDIINDDYRDQLIHMLKKEEKEEDSKDEDHDSSSSFNNDSDSDRVPRRRLQQPKEADERPNKLEFLKQTLKRLENNNENYMEKSVGDFDDVSLNSFLMPDVEHKRKRRTDFKIDDTVMKQGDTTIKKNLISQYKQVLLNFQKNFSSLQNFDNPIDDDELEFENKVYFMIPHEHIIEPSYIVMFELILLDEKMSSTSDRVVAWGAYPLVNRGKFKVPLIRGKYDPNVDKFKDIEGKYMKNIDEWVCNLYFELKDIRLVECAGHKEYMEFPIPSEIQAYLEGKIDENQLNDIYNKRKRIGGGDGEGDGEGDQSNEEEKDEEQNMYQSQSQNLSENEMKKLVKGEFIMNNSDENSLDSESDNESQYDIEGKDDAMPELASMDLRDYKYGITKKLLFYTDEEEEMK